MTDTGKFRILILTATVLAALVLFFNVFQEYFMPQVESYLQRRGYQRYYEKSISKKGLSLHKGVYWKEKE